MKGRRPFIWAIGLAIVIAVVFAAVRCNRNVSIDSCLDMGGKWNHENGRCEGARS
jgi:hypothetical protein